MMATQGDTDVTSPAVHPVGKSVNPNQHTKRAVTTSQQKGKAARLGPAANRSSQPTKATSPDTMDANTLSGPRPRRDHRTGAKTERSMTEEPQDAEMPDVLFTAERTTAPSPVPYDGKPSSNLRLEDRDLLLASAVPDVPKLDELDVFLSHPPLTYLRARATWGPQDQRYPARTFCDVCGYWGRVRCLKCGTRVCALGCLEVHREDCITRYGL